MSDTDMQDNTNSAYSIAASLADISRDFYQRGWVFGTSGNFSAKLSSTPFRLLISSSGMDKGALLPSDFVEVDNSGAVMKGEGRPSAESALHMLLMQRLDTGAVLHTHSIWSTLLSERWAGEGGLVLQDYEMLKGLASVATHKHREWVPILENGQDYIDMSDKLAVALTNYPQTHGVLVRKHGLYTWGKSIAEARRHVEVFEFLFEAEGRAQFATAH